MNAPAVTRSVSGPLRRKLARGAGINLLGVLAKGASAPLQFIILTRLYGRAPIGLFFVAYGVVEIVSALTTWGLVDGALLFASRHLDEPVETGVLYSFLRRIFGALLLVSCAVSALLVVAAPTIGATFYPHYDGFVPVLRALALLIPLNALTQACVSVAKAHLIMSHEALVNGVIAPLAVTGIGALLFWLGPHAVGIPLAYAVGYAVAAAAAVALLARVMPLGPVISGRFAHQPTRGIVAFALPQNLNMALSQLVASMDVLMLGLFGVAPEVVAFYAIGAQVVLHLTQIKRVFSNSVSPVIARQVHRRRFAELDRSFSLVTGWSVALTLPALFIVALFRHELLLLFSPAFVDAPDFMLLLLWQPYLGCAIGLMGNALVMAGFSRWNLLNALTAGATNCTVNALLIPQLGIWGAAIGSIAAATIVSTMQAVEARRLVPLAIPWRPVLTWTAIGLPLFVAPVALLPADLALWAKLAVSVPALALYAVAWRGRRPA